VPKTLTCFKIFVPEITHFITVTITSKTAHNHNLDRPQYVVGLFQFIFCITEGNLDGASPVLNLSKNTANTVSDSDENADEEDEEDYSDNERRSVNKFTSGTDITTPV
jgi:hypothetical protein